MKPNKLFLGAVLATAIVAAIAGVMGDIGTPQPTTPAGVRTPLFHAIPDGQFTGQSELASLELANEWLNSPPLTPSALRGKVVLIDVWTYTCINWLRRFRTSAPGPRNTGIKGLVVIGVHAPEFAFEKNSTTFAGR